MTDETPVDKDSPLWRAWTAYRASLEYENTARWAVKEHHTEGSLWAAFVAGFTADPTKPTVQEADVAAMIALVRSVAEEHATHARNRRDMATALSARKAKQQRAFADELDAKARGLSDAASALERAQADTARLELELDESAAEGSRQLDVERGLLIYIKRLREERDVARENAETMRRVENENSALQIKLDMARLSRITRISRALAEHGVCSRCLRPIDGFTPPVGGAMTAGYYVATAWPQFMDHGDVYVCDRCMWADPRYIAAYGETHSTAHDLKASDSQASSAP